jgi:hypothetical protein
VTTVDVERKQIARGGMAGGGVYVWRLGEPAGPVAPRGSNDYHQQ